MAKTSSFEKMSDQNVLVRNVRGQNARSPTVMSGNSDIKTISIQLGFNVHIQSMLLQYMPVKGTHSSFQLDCLSRTEG